MLDILKADWNAYTARNDDNPRADRIAHWAQREPALRRFSASADIPADFSAGQRPADTDEIMFALIRLAQGENGPREERAGLLLVLLMEPALRRATSSRRHDGYTGASDTQQDRSERLQAAITLMWQTIATYPIHSPAALTGVPARLAWALRRLDKERNRTAGECLTRTFTVEEQIQMIEAGVQELGRTRTPGDVHGRLGTPLHTLHKLQAPQHDGRAAAADVTAVISWARDIGAITPEQAGFLAAATDRHSTAADSLSPLTRSERSRADDIAARIAAAISSYSPAAPTGPSPALTGDLVEAAQQAGTISAAEARALSLTCGLFGERAVSATDAANVIGGISAAAVRQRCSRARQRINDAILGGQLSPASPVALPPVLASRIPA